jgi:hypothetical protein
MSPHRTALLMLCAAIGACAGMAPSPDTRGEKDCPLGQVLVCKGGEANSRVKDSRLNENDICICERYEY